MWNDQGGTHWSQIHRAVYSCICSFSNWSHWGCLLLLLLCFVFPLYRTSLGYFVICWCSSPKKYSPLEDFPALYHIYTTTHPLVCSFLCCQSNSRNDTCQWVCHCFFWSCETPLVTFPTFRSPSHSTESYYGLNAFVLSRILMQEAWTSSVVKQVQDLPCWNSRLIPYLQVHIPCGLQLYSQLPHLQSSSLLLM